jgi:hypothetical protein
MATPIADMVKPMKYSIYPPEQKDTTLCGKRTMFNAIDRSVAEMILIIRASSSR